MDQFPSETLARVVRALDRLRVPYAIIGGVAISIVSTPRLTLDVDAIIWAPDRNLASLFEELAEDGLAPRAPDSIAFATTHRMLLLRDLNGVEVDISLGGLPFERSAIADALSIELEPGLLIRVATPEALVVMKAIASRPKDLEDIRQLLTMNPSLNRSYVSEIVQEFADVLEAPELAEQLARLFSSISPR